MEWNIAPLDGCVNSFVVVFRLVAVSLYNNNGYAMAARVEEDAPLPTPEGRLLRAWRRHRALSQDALGALVKKGGDKAMDGSLIGAYERGVHRPSIDQLLDIVLALGVPGANEEERLARFFAGPDARLIRADVVERDLGELERLRAMERQLGELLAAGRGGQ